MRLQSQDLTQLTIGNTYTFQLWFQVGERGKTEVAFEKRFSSSEETCSYVGRRWMKSFKRMAGKP